MRMLKLIGIAKGDNLLKVGEEELLQLVLLMESVFVIGKDVTQPIMLNSRMGRFVDLMLVIWIFQRQIEDCMNLEKLIDSYWELPYNFSMMNMKDAREVIEAREQIQEDIITYFDDFPQIKDEHIVDICNIIVRNFDKINNND